jgi:GNAT superfamily N-acetyltransferase
MTLSTAPPGSSIAALCVTVDLKHFEGKAGRMMSFQSDGAGSEPARVTVRQAEERDLDGIRALLVRTWHATYDAIYGVEKVTEITDRWHAVENLRRQLRSPLSLFLVADVTGAPTATAKATGRADGTVLLDRLYVDPAAQRSGLGALLLARIVEAFPLAGRIELEVERRNAKAVAFYGKHGFRASGETDRCGGDSGIGAVLMSRSVEAGRSENGRALLVRPARDSDAQDLIGLITLCFAEYPGCYFDPHGDMPDIVAPARSRLATEGVSLVVEDETGRVSACAGVDFPAPGVAELHRLYVRPDARGAGLASVLTTRMEGIARARGAARMTLWSDTRFTNAHALYAKRGYARDQATRSAGDISHSREFFFAKAL